MSAELERQGFWEVCRGIISMRRPTVMWAFFCVWHRACGIVQRAYGIAARYVSNLVLQDLSSVGSQERPKLIHIFPSLVYVVTNNGGSISRVWPFRRDIAVMASSALVANQMIVGMLT